MHIDMPCDRHYNGATPKEVCGIAVDGSAGWGAGMTPEDQDTSSGARLGEYQIGTQLGQDGPLAMYRTLDPTSGGDLALGVIAGPAAERAELLDVIRRVVALKHTHIIPIYDVGAEGEERYLVVPLLRDALRERLARDGALSPMRAGQLVAQIAWAVVAMREANLPEPPIATSNILLDDEGLAILADTSLARGGSSAIRAFQLGGATGWPISLAPYLGAQRRAPATQSELVYSLGTVLYELLTATEKPAKPTTDELEALMVTAPMPTVSSRAPQLWHELEDVMLKALADERERFQDIREFAIEIRRVVSQYNDGAPSGLSLAVLKRGRKTSPPAFRLDEWAFVRPASADLDQPSSEGEPQSEVSLSNEQPDAATPEFSTTNEKAAALAADDALERVTGEEVVSEEVVGEEVTGKRVIASASEPASNTPATEPDPPAPVVARGGRGRPLTLKPNKPVSAAELRARLSGSPAPIPGKRLTGGLAKGQAPPRAAATPPTLPSSTTERAPDDSPKAAERADTRGVRPPAARGRVTSRPLLPPTSSQRRAQENADPDATIQLPVREAPSAELLAQVAARTPPRPQPDVRVRITDPPEVSPIAVRPVLSESTPPMYLGDPTKWRRLRGERRAYPLVVLAVLALVLALGGAWAIALGAGGNPNHSNDNHIVVSATQTAAARKSIQPTSTTRNKPSGPSRPNPTPTATPVPVRAVIMETPTPVPPTPAPTATPSGPMLAVAPQVATATTTASSCSATFTVIPAHAGLNWQWRNDPSSPAPLPVAALYSLNGGAASSTLPADVNTTTSPDDISVTLPCNTPTPVTYVIDLVSGGSGATRYMTFTLTA